MTCSSRGGGFRIGTYDGGNGRLVLDKYPLVGEEGTVGRIGQDNMILSVRGFLFAIGVAAESGLLC